MRLAVPGVRIALVAMMVACSSSEKADRRKLAPNGSDVGSAAGEERQKHREENPRTPRGQIEAFKLEFELRPTIYQPDRVISALEIQSGDIVADVGAGLGLFAYPLSNAVGPGGKVFATEIDPEKIELLNKGKDERELSNLTPVLVDIERVDPFYQTQSFDLLFLSAVYEAIGHPRKFFEELRTSLNEETGRLILIQYRMDPPFNALEFGDFGYLLTTLREYGSSFPVAKRLDTQTKQFLFETSDERVPESIKVRVISELNKMLDDRWLFDEMLNFHVDSRDNSRLVIDRLVHLNDRRLAQWLVYDLTRTGVLDGRKGELNEDDRLAVRRLNRALLMGTFGTQALFDVLRTDRPFYGGLESVQVTLEKAGYAFVKEYEGLLPYHHVWEFGRAR
ncbi:MAG: methyltransferase domain-containing protein [Myxococcota bacterium]|jgi:SAM-dependent methyltransferase|nr:methyltransferase domain-containing protein [Myxococcota bacterium]